MVPAYSLPFVLAAFASVGCVSGATPQGLQPLPSHLSISLSTASDSAFDPNHDELDLIVTVTNHHRNGDVFLANPNNTLAHPLGPNFLFDQPHAALPRHAVASTFRLVTERSHAQMLADVSKHGIRIAPNGGSADFHLRATDHLSFHRANTFNISIEMPLHARYNGKDVQTHVAVTNSVQVQVKKESKRHLLTSRNLADAKTFEFESCLGDEKRTIELWMEGALESVQRSNKELIGGSFAQKGRHFSANRDFCYSASMTPEQELIVKTGLDRMTQSILKYKVNFKCDPKDSTDLCKPITDGTAQIQQVGHSTVVQDSGAAPTITLCAAFFSTAHNCAYQAESAPNLLLGLLSQSLGVTSVRPSSATPDEPSQEVLHSPSRPVLTTLEIEAAVTDTWSQQCLTQDPRGNQAQKKTLCNAEHQQAHNQLIAYHLSDLQQDFKDLALVTRHISALKDAVYSSRLFGQNQFANPAGFSAMAEVIGEKEWVDIIEYASQVNKNAFVGKNKRAFDQFMTEVGRKTPKTCPKAIELLAATAGDATATALAVAQAVAKVYGSTDSDTPLSNVNGLVGAKLPEHFFNSFVAMTKLKAARFGVLHRCKDDQVHVLRAITQDNADKFLKKFATSLENVGYINFFGPSATQVAQRDTIKDGFKKHWARVLRSVKDTLPDSSSDSLREAAMGSTLATIAASTVASNTNAGGDPLVGPTGLLVLAAQEVPDYFRLSNVAKWMYKVLLRSLGMVENFFADEDEMRAAGFGWVAGRVKTAFPDNEADINDFQKKMEEKLT